MSDKKCDVCGKLIGDDPHMVFTTEPSSYRCFTNCKPETPRCSKCGELPGENWPNCPECRKPETPRAIKPCAACGDPDCDEKHCSLSAALCRKPEPPRAMATIEVELYKSINVHGYGVSYLPYKEAQPQSSHMVEPFHNPKPLNDAARELLEPKVAEWAEKLKADLLYKSEENTFRVAVEFAVKELEITLKHMSPNDYDRPRLERRIDELRKELG